MPAVTTEVVYRGHDNPVDLRLQYYDPGSRRYKPLDLAGVNRMVLSFPTATPRITFDSAAVAGVLDWSAGDGLIRVTINQYALPVGVYAAELVAFDLNHPNGQVLIDDRENPTTFDVREVLATGLTPPPLPTGGESVVRQAGEAISALRAVYEKNGQVFYLDPTTADAPVDYFLGITTSATQAGGDVIVQRSGTIDDNGWGWANGLVYVGAAGVLTQAVPTIGWELVVGASPSPARINLDFDEPVLLA
ncbi:hypothetical protein D3C81_572170 [compost metagenome]